jgi:hypothetical protein
VRDAEEGRDIGYALWFLQASGDCGSNMPRSGNLCRFFTTSRHNQIGPSFPLPAASTHR